MSVRTNYEQAAHAEFAAAQLKLKALSARAQAVPEKERAAAKALLTQAQSKHDEALHLLELLKRTGESGWVERRIALEQSLRELRAALASVP